MSWNMSVYKCSSLIILYSLILVRYVQLQPKTWQMNRTIKLFKLKDIFNTSEIATNSQRVSLYSRNGLFMEILDNGLVKGTSNRNSKNEYLESLRRSTETTAILEMSSYGPAYKRIKKPNSSLYLALDNSGRVHTKRGPKAGTLFREILGKDSWVKYQNVRFGWVLGIKRNGKMKKGARVGKYTKSTQFLPLFKRWDLWQ